MSWIELSERYSATKCKERTETADGHSTLVMICIAFFRSGRLITLFLSQETLYGTVRYGARRLAWSLDVSNLVMIVCKFPVDKFAAVAPREGWKSR
jgi:hypothetical protein